MKKFMLIAATAAFITACSDDKTEQSPVVTAVDNDQKILTYIPADTPLLLTSGLNPDQYPDRYLDIMETQMGVVSKYMQMIMDETFTTVDEYTERDELSLADDETAVAEVQDVKTKTKIFIDKWFIDGNLSKVGVEVGETQAAIYMVDLFPVLRLKLSQGHQVNEMFADLEQQFDYQFQTSDLNGIQVREVEIENNTLLIGLEGDFLTVTGTPNVIKDQLINQLVGDTKPSQSLANDPSLIQQVKKAHGYVLDDLMLIDFQKIADHFINPAQHNSALVNFMQIEDNMLSSACKTEISAMFAKAPRIVAGSTAFNDDTINATFVWEMDSQLTADMASLSGRIPAGNPDSTVAMGMSFDLLSAKNLASKYVNNMVNQPFNCELLTQVNQQTIDLQAKLSQPIPPFVGNFKGFNFSLDDLKLNADAANVDNPSPKDIIESFKAQVFLAVDETEALLGMAQMMVPQLQEIDIKADGSLITLADQVPLISGKDIPIDVSNLYAAVASDTIGFSLGHEGGGQLSEKVQTEGSSDLMTFSANADGYKDLMEQIFSLAQMPNMSEDMKKEIELQKQLTMDTLYWTSQTMSMGFSDKGFSTQIKMKY